MPPKRTSSEAHTLLLTAAMESAVAAADWEGFAALIREREIAVQQMIASGHVDLEVVREMNLAEARLDAAILEKKSAMSAPGRKARLAIRSAQAYRTGSGRTLIDQAS